MTAVSLVLVVAVVVAFTGLDGIARGTALRAAAGTTGGVDRRTALAATGPQLLLGHVWLIAAAGLLVGLFPRWEVAVVSHAFWWVLVIAAGLVLRVAAIGVAALGVPEPGATAGAGPSGVRVALAATGALATAAGTGGFLAVAAGGWPVAGAAAVVALDLLLGGWSLGAPVRTWPAAVLLLVPAAVLAAGGAVLGAVAVAALIAAGVALRRHPVLAGTALASAAVVPVAARWPELAVPGTGSLPVADLAAGPIGATLVTTVAGPTFALVLAVQVWFWRGVTPRVVR